MKRVVITGLGVVSCIGNNKEEVMASLKAGKSGISFNPSYEEKGFKSCVSGSIKGLDLAGIIPREYYRFMSDSAGFGYIAMLEAIKDSGLTEDLVKNDMTGLIVGCGGGSTLAVYESVHTLLERGVKRIGPYAVPKVMASTLSANLSVAFGIRGYNYSISSACATGLHNICNAVDLIQLGKQDIVFAGGAEEENWSLSAIFDAMGALSSKRNGDAKSASRPYDADRDGFVIAGGAGIVVVESLESAVKRGAKIYAEITGYGATSDGADMVAPSGEGALRCMNIALGENKNIDYINTHGTSTVVGDKAEVGAVKSVFGDKIPDISSTKSMTGHSLGAAGSQEIIYCLMMMQDNFIAPSINVDNLGAEFAGLPIITEYKQKPMNRVLSNSFGFGGTNGAIVLEKMK